jgi:hypothetical protein
MLIADLDLDNLREIRSHGSVRNLADRRHDLYELRWGKAPASASSDNVAEDDDVR